MDPFRELASLMFQKSPDDITKAERLAAKEAWWNTFKRVAQLPGNEHLRREYTVDELPGKDRNENA